jgi:hypothetical protein
MSEQSDVTQSSKCVMNLRYLSSGHAAGYGWSEGWPCTPSTVAVRRARWTAASHIWWNSGKLMWLEHDASASTPPLQHTCKGNNGANTG